jgi:cytoskeletal protein RodZ
MDHEAREASVLKDSFRQIGADLTSARLARGMQVNELSQLLRISRHYLKNIETGDFDALPGPTYVAGYLRSVAREVGLDAVETVQRYRALLGDDEKGPVYSFPVDTQRPQRSGAMLASIIVIFAVAGYGGWYMLGKPDVLTALTGETPPELVAMPQVESTVTEPDDMSSPGIEPINLAASDAAVSAVPGGMPSGMPSGMSEAGDAAATPLAAAPSGTASQAVLPAITETAENIPSDITSGDAAVPSASMADSDADLVKAPVAEAAGPVTPAVQMLADSTPPAAAEPAASSAAENDVENMVELATADNAGGASMADAPSDAVADDRMAAADSGTADTTDSLDGQTGAGVAFARQRLPNMEITLRATGASWVEIIRNDGEEVMTKLMRAGETYMVDSRDRLYLSTGNAGGLELVFNDGTTRSIGDSGEILRDLLLDATKLRNQF